MSKLLSNVLDKVSENNNEYRTELKNLSKVIDEKTTALVGDVVTLSNYTIDFSSAVVTAKEMLVNTVSHVVESYVIKDLRSVETVNEQFVDKINDKIESSNISNNDEKQEFINNLNSLLNDKYLEIVKIKRVDFLTPDKINVEIENAVISFENYLRQTPSVNMESAKEVLNKYKNEIYSCILESLDKISNLYLNNFVGEVSSAISVALDDDFTVVKKEEEFVPFIPQMPPVPEVINVPVEIHEVSNVETEMPSILEEANANLEVQTNEDINEYSHENESIISEEESTPEIPEVPVMQEPAFEANVAPMDIPSIAPIEPIHVYEAPKEEVRKTYDVEEILKIAKSPVVSMPTATETKKEENYLSVNAIRNEEIEDVALNGFDEKELVEEMISRLTRRLDSINERQKAYDIEKSKIEDDEAFVNNLIESSNNKKIELDEFEKELDRKELELEEKQVELNKKLNDVLPFANAIMKEEN